NYSQIGLASPIPSRYPPTTSGPSVNAPGTSERSRLRWFQRAGLFMAAAALVTLLATARMLSPDDRGHGTHEQLGLPPCTFYLTFGRPCPACGMTTSWAWLLRGNAV